MSAPRKERLEAYLATLRSPSLKEPARGSTVRWQRYVALTGSAVALANASLSGLSLPRIESHEPKLRSAALARAGRNSRAFAAAAALEAVLATQKAPTISPGGVVALDSSVNTIQSGSWVSIYGTNLAGGTAVWNGNFPTSLGGTTVTINGRLAYLSYVSPGQINLQAPKDSTTGMVSVVVTTSGGSATSSVMLAVQAPSFNLQDATHVTAIIMRSDGSGAFGKGTYDIVGPEGDCFGYPTVGAKPGDQVALYGVGFGPTSPVVPPGTPFSGAAPITQTLGLYINNVIVTPEWAGLSSAGLYQINIIVPQGLGQGDVPIQAWVGGVPTQSGKVFTLAGLTPACIATGDGDGGTGDGDGGVGVGDGGTGDGDGGTGDGGTIGDGGGDGGDGGDGGGMGDGDGGMGDGGDGGDGGGDGGDGGDGGGGGDGGDGG